MTGLTALLLLVNGALAANTISESPQLQKCLKHVEEMPDIAAAEAQVWIKNQGGNDAHLCRAFAQSGRGMHEDAAREFWGLASGFDKHDKGRGVMMHNLAGKEFLAAKDAKNAEGQFAAVLKIAPMNSAALVGRAETRMAAERYWDAIDDLNAALKINPDNVDALRQRGRAWTNLGNDKNAQEDLAHAALVETDKTAP
jgi:tetratricopeptide (TPR) repeat protein